MTDLVFPVDHGGSVRRNLIGLIRLQWKSRYRLISGAYTMWLAW